MQVQASVLGPVPPCGRFLTFSLQPGVDAASVRSALAAWSPHADDVVGYGEPLARRLGMQVRGLRGFTAFDAPAGPIPSLQGALWVFLRGEDGGALVLRARAAHDALVSAFRLDDDQATLRYGGGRDLTGYEDGTENPEARALEVVAVPDPPFGCFVSVQRWRHALAAMDRLPTHTRDHVIGRSSTTNEELPDAPPSAHVQRSAQERFDPPAFMLRRSMPWGSATEQGLMFVAFAASLDPFDRVLRRMSGAEDGVVDGLFSFSRPETGAHYWCPPPGPSPWR